MIKIMETFQNVSFQSRILERCSCWIFRNILTKNVEIFFSEATALKNEVLVPFVIKTLISKHILSYCR